jgi:hypothetical protein
LEVELLGERPPTSGNGTRALLAPRFLDIHRITDTHQHVGLIYWGRPKSGQVALAPTEHHAIRWCTFEELDTLSPALLPAIRWYCCQALEEVGNADCPARDASAQTRKPGAES